MTLLLCAPAFGQDRTQEIERKVEILSQEVERLKLGEVATEPEYRSEYGLGPAASKIYRTKKGVSLAAYGELVYENFGNKKEDGTASGKKDQVDYLRHVLYVGYRFTDRILFNSEIEFEHGSTGKGGEVSVEFGYVDFRGVPWLNARAGMVLVPVGIVNEMHEPSTFHGAKRPDSEQNILPTTWRAIGAGLFGEVLPDLSYRTYLTEGLDISKGASASSGLRNARASGAKANAEEPALSFRLDYSGLPGAVLGGSVYTGNSGQSTMTPAGIEVDAPTTFWDLHARWEWKGLEVRGLYTEGVISEVAEINANRGLTGNKSVGERLVGWYLEGAYDLPAWLGFEKQYLAPFVRYEEYDTQARVPAGFSRDPANERIVVTYGLTYKPHPNVAVKADYQDRRNRARTDTDQFNLALAYLF